MPMEMEKFGMRVEALRKALIENKIKEAIGFDWFCRMLQKNCQKRESARSC